MNRETLELTISKTLLIVDSTKNNKLNFQRSFSLMNLNGMNSIEGFKFSEYFLNKNSTRKSSWKILKNSKNLRNLDFSTLNV
jgi:hypothetical protein